jgi:glycosyltransferase involved in cell wall biosynthesis
VLAQVKRALLSTARRAHRRALRAVRRRGPAAAPPAARAWSQPIRVGMYVAANLNVIDGSSVWLQSTAHVLHTDERTGVIIPLRAPDRRPVLTGGLRSLDRVALVDSKPFRRSGGTLTTEEAVEMLEALDERSPFHAVILRSYAVCREAVRRGAFPGRLWAALILEPELDASDPGYRRGMRDIAAAARYVVCQTDAVARELTRLVPEAAGKILLIPPAIPSTSSTPIPAPRRRLLYTGKFAPHYSMLELVEVFAGLRARYPDLEFHVAGDKIFRPPGDPSYPERVERALRGTPGLVWRGGISREDAFALLSEGGIAINVWDPGYMEGLNDLVVPSKTLEYFAAGLPSVLQATSAHREMLGDDYPFFVSGASQVAPAVARLLDDDASYRATSARCRGAAQAFSYENVYSGIAGALDESAAAADARPAPAGRDAS